MARITQPLVSSMRSLDGDLISSLARSFPHDISLDSSCSLYPDRWLLASSLQKCIRRGLLVEATDVAISLHSVDTEYAWRRLRVIALEDVGLGQIEAVATVMAIAGKRQTRDALGDLRLFVGLVQSLAAGMKDRTACDLLCWIEFSPDVALFRDRLVSQPGRWESLATDGDAPIWQRAVALQLIGGLTVRARTGYRTVSKANPEALWRVIGALQLRPLVAFATLKGSGTESLNAALPFANILSECADQRPIQCYATENRSAPSIGGFISPSFCKHTRLGLRALQTFLHWGTELHELLVDAGATDPLKALGLVLFQVESGVLDRVEDYAPKVRIEAERAELANFGITEDEASAALRMMLKKHLPLLNKARQTTWRAHIAEMTGYRRRK